MSIKKICNGFTLLEVIIFIFLFSTIFLTVTYATILSIKTNKINEHKIMATFYAESLLEWLRSEKDASWSGFLRESQLDVSETANYCINDYNISWQYQTSPPPTPTPQIFNNQCGTNFTLGNIYQRDLNLIKIVDGGGSIEKIEVDIVVKWYEGTDLYPINLSTVINPYD